MQDANSDFMVPPEVSAPGASPRAQLLHQSGTGCCQIYRIDRMGRFRVLKCLKPEFRGNALYENLLRKEFEIGYSLRHPGIVEYYGFPQVEGLSQCIEMEWVDGCTLDQWLEKEEHSKEQELNVLDELCDALSYLHARQVFHRDLKPSNILITHSGQHVRLIDFGFSDSDTHSILKTPAGTVNYTAPEVLEGKQADARSDIYSLGIILYGMGRRYKQVARKCCEAKPSRRYASAQEVKKALHSSSMIWAGVLFIVLVAGITLLPYWKDTPEVLPEEIIPVADTLAPVPAAVPEVVQPAKKKEPAAQPKQEVKVDTTLIDDLFRQATDLFD